MILLSEGLDGHTTSKFTLVLALRLSQVQVVNDNLSEGFVVVSCQTHGHCCASASQDIGLAEVVTVRPQLVWGKSPYSLGYLVP